MEIGAMLDELREKALKDHQICQELMDTRKSEQQRYPQYPGHGGGMPAWR